MLQDQLICHKKFHKGIFHELERKLQIKDQVLAPSTSIHENWQVEDVKSSMQEKLTLSKGMMEKDDSSYYSFSRQYGECLRTVEARRTSDEEVLIRN
jgi:hypothetical protein